MSEQFKNGEYGYSGHGRTLGEEFEVAGSRLVGRTKELVREGNVRRLIVKNGGGKTLVEVPLTVGVVFGSAVTIAAPGLAAVGALAALFARFRVQIAPNETSTRLSALEDEVLGDRASR